MNITKTKHNDKLTITVSGRLDTSTAPQLETALTNAFDGIKEMVFDFQDLEYISSAGLRLLLSDNKKMLDSGGTVIISKPNQIVSETQERSNS